MDTLLAKFWTNDNINALKTNDTSWSKEDYNVVQQWKTIPDISTVSTTRRLSQSRMSYLDIIILVIAK